MDMNAAALMARRLNLGYVQPRKLIVSDCYGPLLAVCSLPQDIPIFPGAPADRVDALVIECDPPNRLGWRSYGRAWTIHGVLVDSYHNWFIKPMGPRKCLVTFEEVATGVAARYGRGAYPELVHLSHDHWLEGLKRLSEAHS